jgi:hypothetical protein
MAGMTKEEVRAYLARWDLVHQAEVAELRGTSPERKLQQLEALVASRYLFGPDPDTTIEDREIQKRWASLRRSLSD